MLSSIMPSYTQSGILGIQYVSAHARHWTAPFSPYAENTQLLYKYRGSPSPIFWRRGGDAYRI